MADALGVKAGTPTGERQRAVNRLLAKHIDFVLCRPHDLAITALVELDDSSHNRPDRKARDVFLEKACAAAGVTLLRFPARQGYTLSQVRPQLTTLEGINAPQAPQPTSSTDIGRPRVGP